MDLQYTAALVLNNMYNMQWNDYKFVDTSSLQVGGFSTASISCSFFPTLVASVSSFSYIPSQAWVHDPSADGARDPLARAHTHMYAYTDRQSMHPMFMSRVSDRAISRFHERLASIARVRTFVREIARKPSATLR